MKTKSIIILILLAFVLSACTTVTISFQTGVPCYEIDTNGQITYPIRISIPRFVVPLDLDIDGTSSSLYMRDLEISSYASGGRIYIYVLDNLGGVLLASGASLNFNTADLPECKDAPKTFDIYSADIPPADNSTCETGAKVINASINLQNAIGINDPTGNSILDALPQPNIPLQDQIIGEIWSGDSCGVEDLAADNPSQLDSISNTTNQNCQIAQGINPDHALTLSLCGLGTAVNDLKSNISNGNPNLCNRPDITCQTEWDYEFYWYLGEAYRLGTCIGFPDQFGGVEACKKLLPPSQENTPVIVVPEVLPAPPPPPLD